MYTVFRWINDDESFTIELAHFENESDADQYCVFYATLHHISVDDLMVGYCDLDKFIERLKLK